MLFLILWLVFLTGIAFTGFAGLPVLAWVLLAFLVVWLLSMLALLMFKISNTYTLRQDGLEVKRGIIQLTSFVVTPAGFSDLTVFQSVGGRIFGYGNITITSQGDRKTKLSLVRSPFKVADTMRDILGRPIVRVDERA